MAKKKKSINWAILGLGLIANKFANDSQHAGPQSKVVASASRTKEKAELFAKEYFIERAFGSYKRLAINPSIDAIYIATPHSEHFENMKMCLEFGKHILCEKAFTLNATQAKKIFEIARQKELFVMEAMWTRFLPYLEELEAIINSSKIGRIKHIECAIGYKARFDPASRLYDINLAGGAMLDIGVYAVNIVQRLLGRPSNIISKALIGSTGVDEHSVSLLEFDKQEATAVISCSIQSDLSNCITISGTSGIIKIKGPVFCPEAFEVIPSNMPKIQWKRKDPGMGFYHQLDAASETILEGKTQHTTMPWKDTIAVLEIMDEMRAQWGLKYPQEA